MELLSGLTPEEWERATTCKGWSVKDVALHLLAIEIQFLSMRRDNHFPPGSDISSFEDLVALRAPSVVRRLRRRCLQE